MNSDDIRELNHSCQKECNETLTSRQREAGVDSLKCSMLSEIAAQLAEANEHLKRVLYPPLMYDTIKIDPAEFDNLPLAQGMITVMEPRLTLRDQFAMAAMTGLLSDPSSSGPDGAAMVAYKYADAMLEARK